MDRLRASLADVPIVDFDDYRYFVHPMTDGIPAVDPALLRDVATAIIRRVDFDAVDVILAPESMGIHIATAVSLQVDVPVSIARKRHYGLDGEVSVAQTTGYGENELYLNGIDASDRIVVIDDVISTGGTMAAIAEAIDAIGATLERYVVVFEKAAEGENRPSSDPHVEALLGVSIDGDHVVITHDPASAQVPSRAGDFDDTADE